MMVVLVVVVRLAAVFGQPPFNLAVKNDRSLVHICRCLRW